MARRSAVDCICAVGCVAARPAGRPAGSLVGWLVSAALLAFGGGAVRAEGERVGPGGGGVPSPAPPITRTLDRAVADGVLTVRGAEPQSYASVVLSLENRTNEPLRVDLAGRHLRPTTGNVQRLGLAFPQGHRRAPDAAPGTFPVVLAPNERRDVRMNSCCLDAGKGCPRASDRYVLATAPTPATAEIALRWWTDHPDAPQGVVNSAIWQESPRLLEMPPPTEARTGEPKGRSVRAFQGTTYVLDDGALTSLDPDGIRRFVATRIFQAFPQPAGLLGIGIDADGLGLWRFAQTGSPPWARLFGLEREVYDAILATNSGTYLLCDGTGVDFRAGRDAAPKSLDFSDTSGTPAASVHLAALDLAASQVVAFVYRAGRAGAGEFANPAVRERAPRVDVYDVDAKTGGVRRRKSFWNIERFEAGPAGIFGVSRNGKLERLEGARLVRLSGDDEWTRVVAVGRTRLVVAAAAGGVRAVDARTARVSPLPTGTSTDVAIDPVTDDVVWIEGDSVRRWRGTDEEPERVPVR